MVYDTEDYLVPRLCPLLNMPNTNISVKLDLFPQSILFQKHTETNQSQDTITKNQSAPNPEMSDAGRTRWWTKHTIL